MAKRIDAPRTPLTKERVLRAAIALADAGGIEAVTMRKLARELGVEAMSLYNHVANKNEILAGMIDLVAGEIDMPDDAGDWKSAIRRSAVSSRDAVLRHPWVSALSMSQQSGGPARLRHEDWLLRTLREAGVSKEVTYHALHIIRAYVEGFTLQQLSFPDRGELRNMAARFLQQLPVDDYQDFAEHVRQHIEPREDTIDGFELGLDLILEGLERTGGVSTRRAAQRKRTRGSRP